MYHIKSKLLSPDAEGQAGGTGANPFAPSNTQSAEPSQTTSASAPATSTPAAPAQSAEPTTQAAQPAQPTQSVANQTPSAPTGQQAATTQAQPQAVQLTTEQLQQLLAARQQPVAPAQSAQPQMSEEEFRRQFNIFNANEEAFERSFGVKPTPSQLAAYNEHLQSIARQAVTINRHLMDQKIQELQRQFQPVQQNLEQQTAQRYFNEFTAEYPGLKDYGPLLKDITDAARARGMTFPDANAAKQFVAAQAAKLLNKQVADFRVAAAPVGGTQTQTTSQQSGNRSMSTTSMGGRSGVSGGAAPTQSTAERLFSGAT